MAKTDNLTDFLTGVAGAIRIKKGTTALINPQDFESEIGSIDTAKPEQNKTLTVTENGTQTVKPDTGKMLSNVTVVTNVPATPTEEKTVDLAMASGNQVVTPASGKNLTKVTITKPAALAAGNIKSGVNIGGVTGTYEGESSGSSGGEEVWTLDKSSLEKLNTADGDYADQPFYTGADESKEWFKITVTSGKVVATSVSAPANQASSAKVAPRRASSNPDKTDTYTIGQNDASSNKFKYDSTLSVSRKQMTFPKSVTGGLLAVLTAIAVKQPANYAIQGYSGSHTRKNVTITSNGTTIITPDAPYDAMKDVSVTVNVAGKNKFRELVQKTITELTTEDFAGITTIGESVFAVCSQLKTVTIPNTITYIGSRAFNNCIALKNISFPDSITAISLAVLGGCSALTSFTIPNNVKTIGSSAFYGCEALTSLTIPSKVSSINSAALQIGTTEAKATITMLSTTPPTIATNTFKTARLEKIIVPKGTEATYKAATNWSALADYIQEATT